MLFDEMLSVNSLLQQANHLREVRDITRKSPIKHKLHLNTH